MTREFPSPIPCPFCGTDQENLFTRASEGVIEHICVRCGAKGPMAPTHEAANAFWNTRAERTCRMVGPAPETGVWLCGECGWHFEGNLYAYNYCPGCGARIKREAAHE